MQDRVCPICGGSNRSRVLAIAVKQVLAWNPGYLPSHYVTFDELIGLDTIVELARCHGCGFVFAPAMPSDDLLAYDYGTVNTTVRSQLSAFDLHRRQKRTAIWLHLLRIGGSDPVSLNVLDFGCGWGDFLAIAKAPGVEVVGIEQNIAQVEFCASYGLKIVGQVEDIPPASVDIFISNQVLEHVASPRDVLKSVRKTLKTGAVGYVSVPDFTHYDWRRAQSRIDAGRSVVKEINPWEHLNYYDRRMFVTLLNDCGFQCLTNSPRVKLRRGMLKILKRRSGIAEYVRAI